jgi:GDPmannose 4,6-dehydratase
LLIGDASKAFNKLGWKPTYTLEELVKDMVTNDLELFRKEQFLRKSGFRGMNQYE